MADHESAINRLSRERDIARQVLAAAQAQVDDLTSLLNERLVAHLEDDHNIAVLSRSAGSLKSYHKQAHAAKSCPVDGSVLCQGVEENVLACDRCDYAERS